MITTIVITNICLRLFGPPPWATRDSVVTLFERLEARMEEHVKDKARRKAAGKVFAEMRETREGLLKNFKGLTERLSKAHAGHTTPRADVEKILGEADAARTESWSKQIEARFKLRDTLTREEWAQVFPASPR